MIWLQIIFNKKWRLVFIKLSLDFFQLNKANNKNKQEMFHYALGNLIDTYNNYGEEECKKKNIYYIESRTENNSLLANISVSIIEDYYKYKDLFSGLLGGQTKFFPEYKDNTHEKSGKGSLKSEPAYNPLKKYDDISLQNKNNNGAKSCNEKEEDDQEEKKFKYNLEHFSFYFNGVFFEEVVIKYLFRLINECNENYDESEGNIKLLPRIRFYEKGPFKIKEGQSSGYTELDCCFILKKKGGINIEREKITRFMNFNMQKVSKLCSDENCQDLVIKENSVVIIEIKSSWNDLYNSHKPKNSLEYFVDNAISFINIYKELKLIEQKQEIVFIYFNNSMALEIEKESKLIQKEIDKTKQMNIHLYIAYFQPYCKLLSFYEENKKYNNLVKKTKELEEKNKNLENSFKNQKDEYDQKFKEKEESEKRLIKELEAQKKEKEESEKRLKAELDEQKKRLDESEINSAVQGKELQKLKEILEKLLLKNGGEVKRKEDKKLVDSTTQADSTDGKKEGDSERNSCSDN